MMKNADYFLDIAKDEYISVLLEFYATKSEMPFPSPSELQKVNFWKFQVNKLEKDLFPPEIKGKVAYRIKKGEEFGLNPIQLAVVRYSWNVCLAGLEGPESAWKRWRNYLIDQDQGGDRKGNLVKFEDFQRRRNFYSLGSEVKHLGLWPWES